MHNGRLAERDWIVFGSRWLVLVIACAALLFFRASIGTYNAEGLAGVFIIGAVINGIVLLIGMFAPARALRSAVLFCGDLVLAGLFAVLARGNVFVIAAGGGGLLIAGVMQPSLRWNIAQAVAVFTVITAVGLITQTGSEAGLTALFLLALLAGLASGAYDLELSGLRRRIGELDTSQDRNLQDIRQRTRAISELTYTMSATLNYKKVLDAVIEAGRLGLRLPEREASSLFAGIFLFHVDDNKLHVVSSRRFTRGDELRVISGKEGIVGQALKEAMPVFGSNAMEDPELQNFVGFQGCKSLLCIPLRAGFDNFGVLLYGSDTPNAFTQEHSELLMALGIQATLALQNAVLYHNLIEEKERIVDVDEEARKKLARDLHDGPTQSVAAIAMRMSYINKLFKKSPEQVPDEIKKVEELARRTTSEIRHMLFTLRPLVLETQGLSAALNQLATKTYEMHQQAVATRVEPSVEERLDFQQQGVIFDIAEEAVNNARKHAKAKLISVTVMRQEEMAIVQIADNGVGFDVEAVQENYESRSSLGMVNMRERAELLDGTLRIDSVKGKGTTITIILPLKSQDAVAAATGFGRPRTKLALAAAARIERGDNRQPYL
ncbi:MAG TPA: GAF domain-containing sensor histidine kinase [Phototrophicaceae bacterium]|nr:GAF domain-containing sensor histidine kinase [Phototrophicaceae bacterium]